MNENTCTGKRAKYSCSIDWACISVCVCVCKYTCIYIYIGTYTYMAVVT